MIVIEKPYIEHVNGKVRLSARISIPESVQDKWIENVSSLKHYQGYEEIYERRSENFELWYETEPSMENFLCCERGDAFVLAVLHFAMFTGADIRSKSAVSNELLHNLVTSLIPLHCNRKSGFAPIKIIADSAEEPLTSSGENGTGVSCGVDSFDTIFSYLGEKTDPKHRLSVLTVFNVGAYDRLSDMILCIKGRKDKEWCRKNTEEWFLHECAQGKKIADELHLKFLSVNSNLNELYQGMFLQTHSFRNCSAVLALQKYFSHYYYASAGEPENLKIDLRDNALDQVYLFSTESTFFYSGGIEKNRVEKMQHIADIEIVQKNLHVCSEEMYNCGKCGKCARTLLTLDMMGKLDEFRPVFKNSDIVDTRMWKRYIWMMEQRKRDQFAADIYQFAKENHVSFPMKAQIYHLTFPIRRLLRKTLFR